MVKRLKRWFLWFSIEITTIGILKKENAKLYDEGPYSLRHVMSYVVESYVVDSIAIPASQYAREDVILTAQLGDTTRDSRAAHAAAIACRSAYKNYYCALAINCRKVFSFNDLQFPTFS